MSNPLQQLINQARTIGLVLLLAVLFTQLTACGWRLRGSYDFPKTMETVFVKGTARYSDLGNAIHNALQGTNAKPVGDVAQAQAILQILADKSDQRILSTDSSGRASEYEVSYQLRFKLVDLTGKEMVPEQTITAKREYRFNPSNVLASGSEVDKLKKDMLRQAVQQMLRRLHSYLK